LSADNSGPHCALRLDRVFWLWANRDRSVMGNSSSSSARQPAVHAAAAGKRLTNLHCTAKCKQPPPNCATPAQQTVSRAVTHTASPPSPLTW
jgi:hypothetical protein